MIVDTSVLIAILEREPEAAGFVRAIQAAQHVQVSAGTLIEAHVVALVRRASATRVEEVDDLVARLAIEVVAVQPQHVALAAEAFARFGKGRHRAGLNFGDCFSYALAKASGRPLLCKGNDFPATDLQLAYPD